jgi:RNA polymerase sigma-70 factor (family 1)
MNSTYIAYSDENILALINGNDGESAFAELYDRYFRILFNYTFSKVNDEFTAQEIVQELFVSIWQQRHRSNVQVCRPYLFSIAKNLIISFYRKEFTRQRHYNQWETQRNNYFDSADQEVLASDLQDHYERSLDLLPPKCREVFVLSRTGHSNREIAFQLDISEKTVEQHVTKALRVLKEYLKEHFAYALLLISIF